jgi:hypothetical protein
MPKDTINNRLRLVDEIVQEFTAELLNDFAKYGLDDEEFVAKVKEITGRIPKMVKEIIEEAKQHAAKITDDGGSK